MSRPRVRTVAGALMISAALLTGCSPTPDHGPHPGEDALGTFGHVHGLGIDPGSGTLFAAAHNGLFEIGTFRSDTFVLAESVGLGPIAGRSQDTMGFEMHGDRMYASGHPDPQEDLDLESPNLGLIVSDDSGASWTPVSLHGEVDFHDLAVAEQEDGRLRIYGYDSGTGTIRVSSDSGKTWADGLQVPIRDLTVDAEDPDTVYATTQGGLAVSSDAGQTFSLLQDAPLLLLVESTGEGLIGVAADGTIWHDDGSGSWRSTGAAEGQVQAMTRVSSPEPLLILVDDRGIVASRDDGGTWEVLLPA